MKSFEIKSARLNALCLVLKSLDVSEIESELNAHLSKIQELNFTPFILDLSLHQHSDLGQIQNLLALLERYTIKVLALQHYDEYFSKLAEQLNLVFQLGVNPRKSTANTANDNSENSSPHKKNANTFVQTVIIDKPVRSGQQIYAKNSDLIVNSLVSEGAEIIADGNVHVYAPVRGRVFAGASGDVNAQIFILSMQAQLVCIAGVYRIFDQKLPSTLHKQHVKICLQENKLTIVAIHS